MDDANKKTLFDYLRKLLHNEQDKDAKVINNCYLKICYIGKIKCFLFKKKIDSCDNTFR
jgi:hypothetical protein